MKAQLAALLPLELPSAPAIPRRARVTPPKRNPKREQHLKNQHAS